MKHRFLIHELNHTTLLVDITGIDLPTEIYPSEGKSQTVPSLRFPAWRHAEHHLLQVGANQEVRRTGVAVLTIV